MDANRVYADLVPCSTCEPSKNATDGQDAKVPCRFLKKEEGNVCFNSDRRLLGIDGPDARDTMWYPLGILKLERVNIVLFPIG